VPVASTSTGTCRIVQGGNERVTSQQSLLFQIVIAIGTIGFVNSGHGL
jgi:hypothetical protein